MTKDIIVSILVAVISSSGLWTLLSTLYIKRHERKSLTNKMLLGLAHDRLMWLCMMYVERGYITNEEYENLYNYLYLPYIEMGGNGVVQRLMEEVKKLPIRKSELPEDKQIRMDI